MFERRLARWERKAERDNLEITFGDSRRLLPDAIVQAHQPRWSTIARPIGISPARLSAFAFARASPVAIIDTS